MLKALPSKYRRVIYILATLTGILLCWYWAESKDYFQQDFRHLTEVEQQLFAYDQSLKDTKRRKKFMKFSSHPYFLFPRQEVIKINRFHNTPFLASLTSKTLKPEMVPLFLRFCRDTSNFSWSETTWSTSDSEYYCMLYNAQGKVAGKIYFCLKDCGMSFAQPFAPAMKYGGLSGKGRAFISEFLQENSNWE